ncbi:MAG: phosphoenolpyruvate--protein phosphotransferase [Elusimicrobia bacterium RIFOXYB2_FULL_49_7]|nr:MAG: phosphoenolpyruvate--protein phosphotransferase [Elusimicrobia bacterium RIFOXYB2_FULL_49_7]
MQKAPSHRPLILVGVSLNGGKAAAPICLYSQKQHKTVPEFVLENVEEIERDLRRFEGAFEKSQRDLEQAAKNVAETIGKAEAEIFTAQKHIMADPSLLNSVRHAIREEKRNVEHAVHSVLHDYESRFASVENEYLRERVNDIVEIRRRLMDHLHDSPSGGFQCEGQQQCRRGADRIIVAQELTPSMIANIDVSKVRGFVTEHGGFSSHAAILARSIGVPAVSGIHDIMAIIECGHALLVDGDSGTVYVEPDEKTIRTLVPAAVIRAEEACALTSPEGVQVMANVNLAEDIDAVEKVNGDGIGLFRTEFLFIRANRLLSEEDQADYYKKVVSRLNGKPVTFRLLDVGGDKPLPFLEQEKEDNPYLGLRGSRFLLHQPELFRTQVRALARATEAGMIRMLFPMVIDTIQLGKLLRQTDAALDGLAYRKENLRIGVMFEVVSAVLQAETILNQVDFGSIGTNDLVQYLFAVDRNNEYVFQDYNPDHDVLWLLLKQLADAAKKTGRPLSICGEMASQPGMAARLHDIGITSFSVSPRFIPQVRTEICQASGVY